MTNPGLMKRFFAREAKVGDKTKSLLVEPYYSLVFTGRLPYQSSAVSRIVAWASKEKDEFKVYANNCYSEQITLLVAKLTPPGSHVVNMETDLLIVLNILNRLALLHEPDFKEVLMKKLSYHLKYIDSKELWAAIDSSNSGVYSPLWTGTSMTSDLSDIDEKIGVELVTRRLTS